MAGQVGFLTRAEQDGTFTLAAGGRWDIRVVGRLAAEFAQARPAGRQSLRLDLSGLEALDTAGAWLIYRTRKRLAAEGSHLEIVGIKPDHAALLAQVAANDRPAEIEPVKRHGAARSIERIGKNTVYLWRKTSHLIGFFGLVIETLARTAIRPGRLRFTSLVWQIEQVGYNAVPIVGLMSFLIGIVLAYQGAEQLRRFGADIFVVNLIGISVLREIGVLMTAIIVAGRSGSAFTAQIGAMKVREEIDAMRTLGLDPIEVLVLPRLLGLIVAMPLLGFFADMMGLFGGMVMSWVVLDINPVAFVERLNSAIGMWTFWTGMIKAPFFAALIALTGCYEGLRVEGSAESVGRMTTRAVVESIFLVIVADAAFSVVFNIIGI